MKKAFGFSLMDVDEFSVWLNELNLARTVLYIQQHHTFLPAYKHFKTNNHFNIQSGMKNHHVNNNGWSDIGQHLTIFPDGLIMTGRSLERTPACIYGNNSHSICIEHIGDFDSGQDIMNQKQKDAIVAVTSLLCSRFNIPVDTDNIVYHHWFNLSSGARNNGTAGNKSCPGTNFFGGNKVLDCQKHFLPLVNQWKNTSPTQPAPSASATLPNIGYGVVNTDNLNIRESNSSKSKRLGSTTLGSVLRIDKKKGNWYKISSSNEEWVYGNYVQLVRRATVKASALNVRSGPGIEYPIVNAIENNHEVFIYEEIVNWSRINFGEQWVSTQFVDIKINI